MYLLQPFQQRVDESFIPATERSRVGGLVMIITDVQETPSSPARRMIISRLVCSIVASALRPMPVTDCSKISASSAGVKFLVRCLLAILAY